MIERAYDNTQGCGYVTQIVGLRWFNQTIGLRRRYGAILFKSEGLIV